MFAKGNNNGFPEGMPLPPNAFNPSRASRLLSGNASSSRAPRDALPLIPLRPPPSPRNVEYGRSPPSDMRNTLSYPRTKRTLLRRPLSRNNLPTTDYTPPMSNLSYQNTLRRTATISRLPKSSRTSSKRSPWEILSLVLTFYLPSQLLRACGMKNESVQQAFREKIALCTLIGVLMAMVGFLIFGFNDLVCTKVGVTVPYADLAKRPDWIGVRGLVYDLDSALTTFGDVHKRIALDRSSIGGKDLTPLFPIKSGACQRVFNNGFPFACELSGVWPSGNVPSGANACHDTYAGSQFDVISKLQPIAKLFVEYKEMKKLPGHLVYNGRVLDISRLLSLSPSENPFGEAFHNLLAKSVNHDATRVFLTSNDLKSRADCLSDSFSIAQVDSTTFGCVLSEIVVWISFIFILGTVGVRFIMAVVFRYFGGCGRRRYRKRKVSVRRVDTGRSDKQFHQDHYARADPTKGAQFEGDAPSESNSSRTLQTEMHDADVLHTLIMIPAYSESLSSLTATLDSIARSDFPKSHMCMVVVADGIVQGSGNDKPTPDYLISLMERDSRFEYEMRGSAAPVWLPEALPYVAVAEGMKRKNFARVYAGWYKDSRKAKAGDGEINVDRVPMIVIVKSGTPEEQNMPKPGNRGKRDSQLMLMQFLSRLMFDDRFSALDFDLYEKLKALAGYPASKYQVCLMVDADTRLEKDAISHLVDAFADPKVMGVCGETRICNKMGSWVTAIQVYEYYISHHLSKAFESIFGGVTCLPGCFSGYRIKVPHQKKFADDLYPSHVDTNEFVPILANPDVIATYGEHQVHTLHRKNLLLLGEDRYLTTLMLQAFPKRKNIFVPKAICHTVVPDEFKVLLSQRRRWINSTIHNLWCLIWVRGLCGVFCFSMQFVVFMELIGSLILPAATGFTIYLLVNTFTSANPQILPLILLAAVLGLPAILILLTIRNIEYGFWFFVYLLALPIWQVVLPLYAFWRFDEFGWGETRKIAGEDNGHGDGEEEGVFDWKGIQMKRLEEWLIEKGRADDTKRRTALQLARESELTRMSGMPLPPAFGMPLPPGVSFAPLGSMHSSIGFRPMFAPSPSMTRPPSALSPLSPTYPMNQAPARGMPLPPQQLPQLQRLRSAPKDRRASGLRVVNPSTHNFDGDAPGSMDGRPGEMPLSPTPVYPPQPVSTGHPTLDISFDERAVLAERGMSESPISVSSGRTF